jgi:hypothetical protein
MASKADREFSYSMMGANRANEKRRVAVNGQWQTQLDQVECSHIVAAVQ